MRTAVELAVKALNGGLFVVGFSLFGAVLTPKRFSGLFSAAPSVALGSLTVTILAEGHERAIAETRGMAVGGLAFALSALIGVRLVARWGSLRGSIALCALWLVLAAGAWLVAGTA